MLNTWKGGPRDDLLIFWGCSQHCLLPENILIPQKMSCRIRRFLDSTTTCLSGKNTVQINHLPWVPQLFKNFNSFFVKPNLNFLLFFPPDASSDSFLPSYFNNTAHIPNVVSSYIVVINFILLTHYIWVLCLFVLILHLFGIFAWWFFPLPPSSPTTSPRSMLRNIYLFIICNISFCWFFLSLQMI